MMVKWDKKKGFCNMVATESCKKSRGKVSANVHVVTRGGVRTTKDRDRRNFMEQPLEEKIKNQ